MVVLGVAQLVLPGIAAQRVRDLLGRDGVVRSVTVDAFPAIELLWHQADSVHIVLDSYQSSVGQLQSLLRQAGQAHSVDVSVAVAQIGLLRLHGAELHKRGASLSGSGEILESDLRDAVPFLQGVTPVQTGGSGLTLRGRANVLGLGVSADATVSAVAGALQVVPDVPFGGLATLTLFADPNVSVDSVSGAPAPGGFEVSATGRLR